MSRKIIGLTVGTSISPQKIEEDLRPVKTINGVAPDENGNINVSGSSGSTGQVSWNDITDKPFEPSETLYEYFDGDEYEEVIDLNVLAATKISSDVPSSDIFNDTVLYYGTDGFYDWFPITESDIVPIDDSGYIIAQAFVVITADSYDFPFDSETTITMSKGVWVIAPKEIYYMDIVRPGITIDESCIPDDIPRWYDMYDCINSITWATINDKPFGAEPMEPVTLTFDGNLEDREHVEAPTDYYTQYYVKLSDDTPDMECFLDQPVLGIDSTNVSFTEYVSNYSLKNLVYYLSGDPSYGWGLPIRQIPIVVVKETVTLGSGDDTCTLSPGLWVSHFIDSTSDRKWYISSLKYIPPDIITHLDEKFIPDTIARADDIETLKTDIASFGWDDLKNRPFDASYEEIMAEQTLSSTATNLLPGSSMSEGFTRSIINNLPINSLEEGATYKIVFGKGDKHVITSNEYLRTAKRISVDGYDTVIVLGDPGLIDVSLDEDSSSVGLFAIVYWLKEDGSAETVFYSSRNFSSATFGVYKEIVSHLDEKFVPDSIARVDDLPCRVLEPATTVTYSFDGTLDGKEYDKDYVELHDDPGEIIPGLQMEYLVKASNDIIAKEEIVGGSVTLTTPDGSAQSMTLTESIVSGNIIDVSGRVGVGNGFVMKGSAWTFQGLIWAVREPLTINPRRNGPTLEPGCWIYYNPNIGYVSELTYTRADVVQKMDEKYIPESVVKSKDIDDKFSDIEEKIDNISWSDLNGKLFSDDTIIYEWDINADYAFYEDYGDERYDRISTNYRTYNWVGKVLAITTLENGESVTRYTEITEDMVEPYGSFVPPRAYAINGMLYDVFYVTPDNAPYEGIWIQSRDANGYLYENVKVIDPLKPLDEKFIPDTVLKDGDKEFILSSSTEGSTKKFKITVDDNGTLTATEVVEE